MLPKTVIASLSPSGDSIVKPKVKPNVTCRKQRKQKHRLCLSRSTTWLLTTNLVAPQVPYSRFTPKQFETMLRAGKLCPMEEGQPIRCAAKGFPEQQQKHRLRPVFEPLNNLVVNNKPMRPPLSNPHRLERRCQLALDIFWSNKLLLCRVCSFCHCA